MNVVNSISNYGMLIIFTLIVLGICVAGAYFYFVKIKKVNSAEENVNYSNFIRTDVNEFVKFDDIIQGQSGMGMIAIGNNTFIGGIEVNGYNFSAASASDRERTMHNAIAFFNTIESPIQMCQNVQNIDISQNIQDMRERAQELEIKVINVQTDIKIAVENMKRFASNDELFSKEEKRVEKLIHTMSSLEWQLSEAKEMVHYMEYVSDASFNTKKTNQLIFSYTYNPDEDLEELSDEEILLRAEAELKNLADIYGGSLENTGCTWKVITADGFTDLLRRHFHPITSDEVRLDDLLNSSYKSLYVTTDSIEEIAKEKRGEIEFEREMLELEERLRENEEAANRKHAKVVEEVEQIAGAAV
ncbi:hypothetical protein [Butyrivibrio hungatei]|uniref:Uncharacterized protein n=1 Tax=Butyrivibrio hungatei TaxID=185008 RepID=A0A1D9P695_9FIRM|nr:hypothetical protein [Butyrivibrio hungatei]AOZ97834.1 hypothetical protein bhn_II035 [Butyrivibrio hungatei]